MKAWKIIGYSFACLGALLFVYGFFVGLMDTINPSTIFLNSSSDPSLGSFFSVFWSAIAPWMVLATITFVVGGFGLYAGRNPKKVKPLDDRETINARLYALEKMVARNLDDISKRLDGLEKNHEQKLNRY
jgi:hypothetical protein